VGWAKRGPSGTIPTNRAEAQQVAQRIATESNRRRIAGWRELKKLLAERHVCSVDYTGWRQIDAAELAAAEDGRCRRKFTGVAEMLQAAHAETMVTEYPARRLSLNQASLSIGFHRTAGMMCRLI